MGFRLWGSGVQGFRGSGVQGFRGSGVQGFRGSGVQGFRGSVVQGFRGSGAGEDGLVDPILQARRDRKWKPQQGSGAWDAGVEGFG